MSAAIVTASYAGDYERCRLLCASIDRYVTGWSTHYILVDVIDRPLFQTLESDRRRIISERQLFPEWLRSWPDPLTLGRRRVWTGPGAMRRGIPPLRGWHAQQLRKLALPLLAREDVFLYADSDVVFLKAFDTSALVGPEGVRLYCKRDGITSGMAEHIGWCRAAASKLGLPEPTFPCDDYINNLVVWTGNNVRALHAHIERVTGRDWLSAVAADRGFSEYTLYGFFVDQVLGARAGHARTPSPLARTFWGGEDAPVDGLHSLQKALVNDEVAVGIQSFIGRPVSELQSAFQTLPS